MGIYANIKSKQFVRFLKKLERKKGIELTTGGKHNYIVSCIHNGKSYPIPCGHSEINKNIVKDFMEWLVTNQICTEREFNELL